MLVLESADHVEVCARAIVLALGVEYRRLEAEGAEALEGAGVYYGASVSEAHTLAGEPVVVVGGGNSAGQAALHLARHACTVTMVVRGTGLAASMSQYLIDAIEEASNISVRYGTAVVAASGNGRLESVTLRGPEGDEEKRVAGLVVLIGALPRTEWLPAEIERDEWGYLRTGPQLESWSLERPPFSLETSMPGVFAAGDVRAASVKRVAAAAGSGALAVTDVHAYLASPEHAGWRARS
jgi:thioredoxin reductase (NADPH)